MDLQLAHLVAGDVGSLRARAPAPKIRSAALRREAVTRVQVERRSTRCLTSPHKFARSTAGIGKLVTALAKLLQERGGQGALQSDVL